MRNVVIATLAGLLAGCTGTNPGMNPTDPGASDIICVGDVDTELVCYPAGEMWTCDDLPGAKTCTRDTFAPPTGTGDWRCEHDGEHKVVCTKDEPDAVGGGSWQCEDRGENQRVCTSTTSPNGPSGDGEGGGTEGGTSGATPDGGGNWVCVSDGVTTVCESIDELNGPPGGIGDWNCTVSVADEKIVCTSDSAGSAGGSEGGSSGGTQGGTEGGLPSDNPFGTGNVTCYCPPENDTKSSLGPGPVATLVRREENHNGVPAVYARLIFSTRFNDNTYGANSSPCWFDPEVKGPDGPHQFKQLVGSDAAELNFYDCDGNRVLGAVIDYISPASLSSGYDSLCVSGGDGKMSHGSASDVLGCHTSLDENFNTHGYVLTEDSPPFMSYQPSPGYEDWIYEVWYGIWVRADAFGSAGACKVTIDYVHASPACGGANSIEVVPCPC